MGRAREDQGIKVASNPLRALLGRPAYTLMRGVARFSAMRSLVSSAKAALTQSRTARVSQGHLARQKDSAFKNLEIDRFSATLSKDGVAEGLKLPSRIVAEIITWTETQPVYGMRNPARGFWLPDLKAAEASLGESIILAQYFNCYRGCGAIRTLADDPILNLIALRHLGTEPKFLGANLWWTFPGDHSEEARRQHAQYFHRDVDDFKFIKFFFYLTDVLPGDGGHWVVKGSQEIHPHITVRDLFALRRFEDYEISDFYSSDKISEITGAEGAGFAENTLCVHKAGTPTLKPRLLLQLQYGLFRYEKSYDEADRKLLKMCKLGET